MAYTPPPGGAVDFSWQGEAPYTPPAGDAIAFSWSPGTPQGRAAAPSPLGAPAARGAVDVAGRVAAPSPLGAPVALDQASQPGAQGVIAAPSPLGAPASRGAGPAAGRIVVKSPLGAPGLVGRQVVSGRIAVPSPLGVSVVVGRVLRYEIRGAVRINGVLVDRRVRAHRIADGALLGETDTVAGRYRCPAGFAAAPCYVIPLDLSAGATDWAPPCANHVVPELADDLAEITV